MLTLNGLKQRRNVGGYCYESLAKRFAETAPKHQIQLVMQELSEIGSNGLRQHAYTLEDRLLGQGILLPTGAKR